MKKILLTIMLQCFALLFLIFGCGGAQIDGEGSGHEPSSALNDSGPMYATPAPTQEIFYSPVDLVSFSSLDEFVSYLNSEEKGEDIANLASLKSYYLPTAIPEGYELYKITAGGADIGFWYLPQECLSSAESMRDAEAQQKHFLFISSRGTYDFNGIKTQFNITDDELIDNKYFMAESSTSIIIWEEHGTTLMLYLPVNLEALDVTAYCDVKIVYVDYPQQQG